MRRNLVTAVLYTVVTTVLFGLVYPFVVTGLAQMLFHDKANGQLIYKNGELVGSRIIGQSFTSPQYFHSRPSAAGNGYDAYGVIDASGTFSETKRITGLMRMRDSIS